MVPKVFPLDSCSSCLSGKRETFTVWMKSLLMQGNGCTVFNSNGDIVYRIDNYDDKCSSEVCLMDLHGRVLVTIVQRKVWPFKSWEIYKQVNREKPWLRVKTYSKAKFRLETNDEANWYQVETSACKSQVKILDGNGNIVAEAERKRSSSGVVLGNDVLALTVEADVDHSFIITILTVYGLINKIL
ncbi:protein LURP-one-related 4-like [Carica papaya]|uniref:protein LURP-one-related 4-like n=1 Tax=Carica papaya TaxID=3649 RepID=UPI000B8CF65C|nr:protein LURP-one-related 4-like [Carica papaya]